MDIVWYAMTLYTDNHSIQLRAYLQQVLKETFINLELDRRKGVVHLLIAILLICFFLLVIFSGVMGPLSGEKELKWMTFRFGYGYMGGITLLFAIYFLLLFNSAQRSYRKKYKRYIFPEVLQFLEREMVNINFQSDGFIPISYYKRSQLFDDSFHCYTGKDLISGKLGEIQISCSKIAGNPAYRFLKSFGGSSFVEGIFFVARFNKVFRFETMVFPRYPERIPKRKGIEERHFIEDYRKNHQQVIIDNKEFTERFIVYGDAPNGSHQQLSDRIIQKLIFFEKRSHHPIHLFLKGDTLYILITLDSKQLDPKTFRSAFSLDGIEIYSENLKMAFELLYEFDLSQRIWRR